MPPLACQALAQSVLTSPMEVLVQPGPCVRHRSHVSITVDVSGLGTIFAKAYCHCHLWDSR